jgi:L-asparagine transporter-like permease
MTKKEATQDKKLKWWQLSLLGVAFTIGTGYFLGSGIAIRIGGPGALVAFALAAFGTYLVFDALARMTSAEPLEGSFRSYAKKAYGGWAGFSSGWVYWSSELLIMGSQMTALSLFSRFWFPNVPMWLFAILYAVLGLVIVLLGTKGFERFENVFAIMKVSAIIMFLIIAAIGLFGWLGAGEHEPSFPPAHGEFAPNGALGLWSSLLFAFYAFGGIEIMGIMAMRLQRPQEASKAGTMMLSLLAVIYMASLVLAVTLVPWRQFDPDKSPFLTALEQYGLPFVPHLFNAVLIIAGFSTMTASLFAVTKMLVTLAEDRDAPRLFAVRMLRNCPLPAIGLTAAGLVAAIVSAMLMPGSIYEYVTTAAGLMLLYNWFFILVTTGKLVKLTKWGHAKRFIGMGILLVAVTGALFHETSRPGFYISFAFVAVIAAVTFLMRRHWTGSGGQSKNAERKIIGMEYRSAEQQSNRLKTKIRAKND